MNKVLALEILKTQELEKKFNETVKLVNDKKTQSNLSNNNLLIIYGLYKQATEGDNIYEQPNMFQIIKYNKWIAWNKYKGMKQNEAKKKYIEIINEILHNNELLNKNI